MLFCFPLLIKVPSFVNFLGGSYFFSCSLLLFSSSSAYSSIQKSKSTVYLRCLVSLSDYLTKNLAFHLTDRHSWERYLRENLCLLLYTNKNKKENCYNSTRVKRLIWVKQGKPETWNISFEPPKISDGLFWGLLYKGLDNNFLSSYFVFSYLQ